MNDPRPTGDRYGAPSSARSCWIDLLDPSREDAAEVERTTGLALPSRAQLSEVEVSSRLRRDGEALFLSLPLVFRDDAGHAKITPVGFVLSGQHLVTIRYEKLKAFGTCRERVEADRISHPCSATIFVALLEAIVDRLADILEEVGADLDTVATEVFGADSEDAPGLRPKDQDFNLRQVLRRVGRARTLVSKVRATLLGIARIAPFVLAEGEDWLPRDAKPRLETIRQDVNSLDEYEVHLSDKVQFLLDADLGFINIEQNDRFRILTIVSVVGIPPTLVASMYGMNFKHMPELDWAWGYPYGLALIALSALIPVAYFKVKGWF